MNQLSKLGGVRLSLMALTGFAVFGATAASGFVFSKSADPNVKFPTEGERKATFDKISTGYDQLVAVDEKSAGVLKLRQQLIGRAKGDVLEVAAGTARNLLYYDSNTVSSIMLTDFSREMLRQGLNKKEDAGPIPLRFKVANASKLDFPDATFDTVVDTFGLCSFENPVEVLKELKRVLKPGGEILLLEHGKAKYSLITNFLNNTVKDNVHKYGCYHNRDILAYVREAGLEVRESERKHWGATYSLVCVPSSKGEYKKVVRNIDMSEGKVDNQGMKAQLEQEKEKAIDEHFTRIEEEQKIVKSKRKDLANQIVEKVEVEELSAEARAMLGQDDEE